MFTKDELVQMVKDFINNDPANRVGGDFGEEKMWDEPLVGFVNGADPIFNEFKARNGCGMTHWMPEEIFNKTFPDRPAKPEELTIISWVLPQTEKTREGMRTKETWPTERWARSRIIGETINDALRRYVVQKLTEAGIDTLAPMLHPDWHKVDNEIQVYTSTWSERHIAHAAGLGTFSFNDALITRKGIGHRVGSVVCRIKIEPDKRPYKGRYDWCLHYAKGGCMQCAKRCPAGAITPEEGHVKQNCKAYVFGKTIPYIAEHFHLDGYGCGFCQVGVPCEKGIPDGIEVEG